MKTDSGSPKPIIYYSIFELLNRVFIKSYIVFQGVPYTNFDLARRDLGIDFRPMVSWGNFLRIFRRLHFCYTYAWSIKN